MAAPWETKATTAAAPPWETDTPAPVALATDEGSDWLGVGEEVRGFGRALNRGTRTLLQQTQLNAIRHQQEAGDELARLKTLVGTPGAASHKNYSDWQTRIRSLEKSLPKLTAALPLHAGEFAAQQSAIEALPQTKAQEDFHKDETPWWHFFANPVELSALTLAESYPVMAQTMAAAPGGPMAVAAAAGTGSHSAEAAGRIKSAMIQAGVDLKKPEQVMAWFGDRAKSDPEIAKADLAALGPASFDALTGGLAGKFLGPALGKGTRPVLTATAKEMGLQMAGGGVGSIAASQLASEPIDWKDVVLEVAGEFAPGEAFSNVKANRLVTEARAVVARERAKPTRKATATPPWESTAPQTPDARPKPPVAGAPGRFIFDFNGNELVYEGVTEEQAKELAFRQNPGATFVRAEPFSPAAESTKNVPGATGPTPVAPEQSDAIEYAPWETEGGTPGTSETEDASVDYPYSAANVAIEPQTTTELSPDGHKVVAVEFPVAQIEVDPVLVPQFKNDADETTGEVRGEELKGTRYERPSNPIVIWQLRNGRNIVVTGRHRFALAKRLGEQTIPATIVREADGFTRQHAITLDAEFNIRDGNGSVDDYANYIENTPQLTEEEARARGLLDRAKGQAAWHLARSASDDLKALYKAGKIAEREAVAIASSAPGDAGAQAIGSKFALAGRNAAFIRNVIKASQAAAGQRATTLDLFGNDDAAMQEMEAQAERASQFEREIAEQIRAVQGAAKRPDVARKLGVDVQDPAGIALKIIELKNELARWANWPLHPDLVARVKGLPPGRNFSLAQGGFELNLPESVAEQKARLAEEKRKARLKQEQEAMLAAAQARLTTREDTQTVDMFASPEGRTTRQDKSGQGSLFSLAARFEGRMAELDEIASDLYGKPYDELTEFQQGNAQVTLEHEDATRAARPVSTAPGTAGPDVRSATPAQPAAPVPARALQRATARAETARQRDELAVAIFGKPYADLQPAAQTYVRAERGRGRIVGRITTDAVELRLQELWDEYHRLEERLHYASTRTYRSANRVFTGPEAQQIFGEQRRIVGQLDMLRELLDAPLEFKRQWFRALSAAESPQAQAALQQEFRFSLTQMRQDQATNQAQSPDSAIADVQQIVTEEAGDAPVRVIHDATLTHNGQMVEGYLDPNTGQIVINAAAPTMRDPANVRRVIREERAHWLLNSPEGQAELRRFTGRLTPAQRAELQRAGYRRQKNESAADYEARLANEFIAKQARENTAWWRKLVERVREWLAAHGLAKLTNEEAARAILRRLNAAQLEQSGQPATLNSQPAFSLAPVTPVSPATQTQMAVIEHQSGNVNEFPAAPTLATTPELRSKLRDMMGTVSGVIHYYGGANLLRAKRGIDLTASYQAAAVAKQSDALLKQLFSNAYQARKGLGSGVWGLGFNLPQWMKVGAWARRVVAFKKRLLHVAARLNATGRNPDGSFAFENFKVRSGLMTMGAFKQGKHAVGDTFMHVDPQTEVQEEFEIGEFVTTPDGRAGYQIYRRMEAQTQAELYRAMSESFPELTWLLDMFIDPALADARQTINGIQIPVFNRFAQAAMMAEADPNFTPLTGYTPDVLVSRSLLGAIRGALSFSQGTRSPGRKYKFGTSRESGHVRDLLTGFNIRTFQMLQEKARRAWRNEVLRASKPIPRTGVPAGWVKLETGMEELFQAAKRLRNWTSPVDPATGLPVFPETQARMADDGSPEYKDFFKEVFALRGKQLMLPQPIVNALLKRYAIQKEHGALYRLAAWAIRNSTQLFLVAPKTYVANVLTNDLFTLEAATRYGLHGLITGNTRNLRFARNLFTGMFTNRFAAFRQGTGFFAGSDYMTAIRETLPDQVFADNTSLADVKVRWGHSALDYLRQGEIGGFALQLIQYGQIDVRGKQRMAFAFLKANAVSNARRAGLKGMALKAAVDRYLLNPPASDRVQAVTIANFELLNYADSPQLLEDFSRNDFSRLVLPFPRFGYHYVTKQLKRLSAAKVLIGKVPKGQRADAFADLVTVGLFGLGGGGILANALLAALAGDDDDDDARQRIGTSTVPVPQPDGSVRLMPIDREFVTANRINISAWARAMGIESGNEDDFWLRVRNYPVVAAAGVTALAYNDAKKHGAELGARQFMAGAGDLTMDFFSIGAAIRVPAKVFVEWQSLGKPIPASSPMDPYATGVPLSFYITEQLTDSIIPGSRQADELLVWVNPVRPRRTASKTLGYSPGVVESLESSHLTGLLNNLARGGESGLPPAGAIDRRTGTVPSPSSITPAERISSVLGFNVKAIPRHEYQNAITP